MKKIAIIGAGPAGIYCALQILEQFKDFNFNDFYIDIFDKSQVLRTILPTGNGRCNITNSIEDIKEFCSNYPRGEKFLYSVFSRYSNSDTISYFKSIGIETYTQEDGRIFPKSDSAKDVKDKLLNRLNKFKNFKLINKQINSYEEIKNYDKIVISTGSKDSDLLKNIFKDDFIPFKKTLCALKIENNIYPKGVSINAIDGDFIFTHKGVSGPLIFTTSSKKVHEKYPYILKIKLFNKEDLEKLIKKNPKKSIGNLVSRFVPKSFARIHVQNFDKNSCEISKKEIENLSYLELKITGTLDSGEIVNAGGIDLKSVDKNLKSKKLDNIWICGEALNIDGLCGGFNLQNCWSGGYIAASDIVNSIIQKEKICTI